jgi:hypothetical protein
VLEGFFPVRRDCSRDKCYVFETLGKVRRMTADWIARYNEGRVLGRE